MFFAFQIQKIEISSKSDAEMIPHEISESAKAGIYELLPLKSGGRYKLVYNLFKKCSNDKNVHTINEQVIIKYIIEKT